jgi:hypothetical protein
LAKIKPRTPTIYIGNYLKYILGALLGMFISGTAMTSIGQPTTNHVLSHSGNSLWHVLLGLHLTFLTVMTISAIGLFITTVRKVSTIKTRAAIGLVAILFGIVSGILVLHKIHPGIFLFCMALSFVFIGASYGPIGSGRPQIDESTKSKK